MGSVSVKEQVMLLRMYCLFDRVAMESPEPFACKNDAVAVRAARFGLAKQGVRLDEHRLFFVGTFDTETSKMTGLPGDDDRVEIFLGDNAKLEAVE